MDEIFSDLEQNVEKLDFDKHNKILRFMYNIKTKNSIKYVEKLTGYCFSNPQFQNVSLVRALFKTRNSLKLSNYILKNYILNNFSSFKSIFKQKNSNKLQFLLMLSENKDFNLPAEVSICLNEYLEERYKNLAEKK